MRLSRALPARLALLCRLACGLAGAPALPASAQAGSSDALERQAAAEALRERASAGDPDAIAALLPLLHSSDSKLRYHAEWGLMRAGAPAVPPLLEELRRRREDAGRARVAGVLGQIGLAARAAAPDLREALREPDSETARQAAQALGAMRAREALPELTLAYAASRRLPNQRQMARAIQAIGSDQAARASKRELVARLGADLADPDAQRRAATLEYVVGLYGEARDDARYELPTHRELAPLVPGLLRSLDDPAVDPLPAVRALGMAGAGASAAVPALASLLGDPRAAGEAKRALAAIDGPEALRALAERAAFEALEQRIRSDFAVQDHQGRTRLLPFQVAGGGGEGVRMEARFLYPGRQPRRPERVVVAFESVSPEPRLAQLTAIEWRADAARLRMDDVERSSSESQTGGVIEWVSGTLSVADFRGLAHARELRVALGPLELEIAPPDRAALRHFAARIPPAPPAAPAP